MPIKIVCSKCNFELHNSPEFQPLEELVSKIKQCPNCQAVLHLPPKEVWLVFPDEKKVKLSSKMTEPSKPKKTRHWWRNE